MINYTLDDYDFGEEEEGEGVADMDAEWDPNGDPMDRSASGEEEEEEEDDDEDFEVITMIKMIFYCVGDPMDRSASGFALWEMIGF